MPPFIFPPWVISAQITQTIKLQKNRFFFIFGVEVGHGKLFTNPKFFKILNPRKTQNIHRRAEKFEICE